MDVIMQVFRFKEELWDCKLDRQDDDKTKEKYSKAWDFFNT